MYVMNTVFSIPEMCLFSDIVSHLIRAAIVIKSDMSRMLAGSVVSTKRQPEFVPAMTNI